MLRLELQDNRISTEAEFWGSSMSTKVTNEFPTLLVRKRLGIVFEELVQMLKDYWSNFPFKNPFYLMKKKRKR